MKLSQPMKPSRFNLLAIGARASPAYLLAEELSYWSDAEERVIGLVLRDRTDDDYGWVLMVRDNTGRFRWVDGQASLKSERFATIGLRERIGRAIEDDDIPVLGLQGDETNYPIDLLRVSPDTRPEVLHPFFKVVLEHPSKGPARAVLREIGPWLTPSDPHFVTEFQTKHFDQRLWELYLWAALRELGFDLSQPEAPDFLCRAPGIEFTVEATTASPSLSGPLSIHPNPETPDEMRAFLRDYMPMKFGSCLLSKLEKKNKAGQSYWERGDAAGKPFLIAVADFHKPGDTDEPGSMSYTQSALPVYLYGRRMDWEILDGTLVVRPVRVPDHQYEGKIVPSGFFDIPGAENVSGVLFSNAGTVSKFNRMGIVAGYPMEGQCIRIGLRLDPDPNATKGIPFSEDVMSPAYQELWSDELQLFHNPNAKHPLDPSFFSGITQHFFRDGKLHTTSQLNTVLASRTMTLSVRSGGQQE